MTTLDHAAMAVDGLMIAFLSETLGIDPTKYYDKRVAASRRMALRAISTFLEMEKRAISEELRQAYE